MIDDEFIYTRIVFPVALLAAVFISFTILVLSRLDKEAKLFSFLKLESIFCLIDCLITSLVYIYKCTTCQLNPVLQCVFNSVFFNSISGAAELSSFIMAIFAALSLYLIFDLNNRTSKCLKFIFRPRPAIIAALVFFISMLIFSYNLYVFAIFLPQRNWTEPNCDLPEFNDPLFTFMSFFSFVFSHGLMIVILIIINVIILFKTRKSLNETHISDQKSVLRRRVKEKNLTIMILFDCTNLVIGRLPLIVFFMLIGIDIEVNILPSVSVLIILVSLIFKFFFYFNFNNRFRSEALKILGDISSFWRV